MVGQTPSHTHLPGSRGAAQAPGRRTHTPCWTSKLLLKLCLVPLVKKKAVKKKNYIPSSMVSAFLLNDY